MSTKKFMDHVDNFQVAFQRDEKATSAVSSARGTWKKYAAKMIVAPSPPHVDIELTNICDLECDFCETLVMQRKKGSMSLAMFQRVVDQCAEAGVPSIKLNLWGESLLNKKLIPMIEYAKKRCKAAIQFNTNANRLTPKIAEKLVLAGLDCITISVDGFTKETYEKLRIKGKYDVVLKNIDGLLEARARHNSAIPEITMQIIKMKENIDEVEAFVAYWKERVDQVSTTNIGTTSTPGVLNHSVRINFLKGRKPCDQIWQRLSVLWDGRVTVCCNDFDGSLVVGDVLKDRLAALWAGERLTSLREKHLKLDFSNLICGTCTDSMIHDNS